MTDQRDAEIAVIAALGPAHIQLGVEPVAYAVQFKDPDSPLASRITVEYLNPTDGQVHTHELMPDGALEDTLRGALRALFIRAVS